MSWTSDRHIQSAAAVAGTAGHRLGFVVIHETSQAQKIRGGASKPAPPTLVGSTIEDVTFDEVAVDSSLLRHSLNAMFFAMGDSQPNGVIDGIHPTPRKAPAVPRYPAGSTCRYKDADDCWWQARVLDIRYASFGFGGGHDYRYTIAIPVGKGRLTLQVDQDDLEYLADEDLDRGLWRAYALKFGL